jgi:hypothetical protein
VERKGEDNTMSKTYVITGTLRNGKRFKPIETSNKMHAMGINLWNGSVFEKDTATGKRKLIKRVVN